MEINRICFKETKKEFEEYLLALGYSKDTVEWYQKKLLGLEKFLSAQVELAYSAGNGAAFLKEVESEQSIRSLQSTRLAIRRLDEFMNGEYYFIAPKDNTVPDCFLKDFNAYIEDLRLTGHRESTIRMKSYQCIRLLEDLHKASVYNLSAITPQVIYHVFSKSSNKINLSGTLRLGY